MRPPFAIKLADRKVASLKVLFAHHETIHDRTGRPKSGFAQGTPGSPRDLRSAIVVVGQKVALVGGTSHDPRFVAAGRQPYLNQFSVRIFMSDTYTKRHTSLCKQSQKINKPITRKRANIINTCIYTFVKNGRPHIGLRSYIYKTSNQKV